MKEHPPAGGGKQGSIRLPPDAWKEIDDFAKKNGWNRSQAVTWIILAGLRASRDVA